MKTKRSFHVNPAPPTNITIYKTDNFPSDIWDKERKSQNFYNPDHLEVQLYKTWWYL